MAGRLNTGQDLTLFSSSPRVGKCSGSGQQSPVWRRCGDIVFFLNLSRAQTVHPMAMALRIRTIRRLL